jgi:hypothetical protein
VIEGGSTRRWSLFLMGVLIPFGMQAGRNLVIDPSCDAGHHELAVENSEQAPAMAGSLGSV